MELLRGDHPVTVSSPKQRLLLALFLVHANEVVSVDALIDGVWGAAPPGSATGLVQTYVSQLRKLLETTSERPVQPRVLLRTEAGYRLLVDPEHFDASRFERLLDAGRSQLVEGRGSAALALLSDAVAQWRGTAFGEFSHQPAIQPAAERLSELYGLALEYRTDAAIELGHHAELLGELERRVADHPMRERSWAQLMLCLYRSGRQADALGAFARLRRHLAEELGLQPSTMLRNLESQILQQTSELDWAPPEAPAPPGGVATVHRGSSGHRPEVLPAGPNAAVPSGTVTFLFTDVEGSTPRWEADPEAMRAAMAAHDDVMKCAVSACGGWLFKHTGDGVCAAFGSAQGALDAAVAALRELSLPVRMGIATGVAELRGADYYGPVLNRAARVMAAGHGGQVLVAESTAALLSEADLVDLGQYSLRGLMGLQRLFQVRADGLGTEFPPLRAQGATPGNLPAYSTSLIGRQQELGDIADMVRAHRLATLTGVGGVGKTSLALGVAAELVEEFPDGVWLVELAATNDPASVPDLVAGVLGVTAQAGCTVSRNIANSLSGRQVLIVLDNCEHVLDAAAELVDTMLASTTTVRVLATSREGLRASTEQLWPVQPLDVTEGTSSAAVELFLRRAHAALPGFDLSDDRDAAAATEICRRLDGIPLAIELAAARMISLSPQDVRDRLDDRFRLLRAPRRGAERHQTLRNVVQWSFDLLSAAERTLLARCAVFSDGFDLEAATEVCGEPLHGDAGIAAAIDEFEMLELLDSLARKSLITVDRPAGRARFGMLETIRQFAAQELARSGADDRIRRRHAAYLADRANACYSTWHSPGYRTALDWLEPNLANLRSGFRWALSHDEIVIATAIAAHTAQVIFSLQQTEPIAWAEEAVPAATAADVPQLPRLLVAASLCSYTGRAADAVGYAQRALDLEGDPRYDPYEIGMAAIATANAQLFCGRPDRYLEICTDLARRTGFARQVGLAGLLNGLTSSGRGEEARALAEEALAAVREQGSPFYISFALLGFGRAFAETDPQRARKIFRDGVAYTADLGLMFWGAVLSREAASHEAIHGDLHEALDLFDSAIQSQHRANNVAHVVAVLASLAVFFNRLGEPLVAATIYGSSTPYGTANRVKGLRDACAQLRVKLGDDLFEQSVSRGAAMNLTEAVHHARQEIQRAYLADAT